LAIKRSDSYYKGKIVETNQRFSLVEIGNEIFIF
jgi:hypothetical protein